MKNGFHKIRFIPLHIFFIVVLTCLCIPVASHALFIDSFDYKGVPVYTSKEISEHPDDYLKEMESEFRFGNLANIYFIGKMLVKATPENKDVRALLSICLSAKGEIEEAEKQLESPTTGKFHSFYNLCAQAMILKAKGKTVEALLVCQKALAEDKHHPYPHNIMGRIYLAMGQLDKALESFKQAIKLNPNFLPAYTNIGAIYYIENKYSEAVGYFSEAVQKNTQSFNAHYGLAAALESTGDLQRALHHSRESLKIRPDSKEALQQTAALELKNAMFEDAMQTARKMERLKLSGAEAIIADAALHLNDVDTASKYLVKLDEASPDKDYLQGYYYLIQGNYKEAQVLMKQILTKNPNHFGAFLTDKTIDLYLAKPIRVRDLQISKWGEPSAKLLSFFAGIIAAGNDDWQEAYRMWDRAQGFIGGFAIDGITPDEFKKDLQMEDLKHLSLGILYYYRNFFSNSISEFQKVTSKNPSSIFANYFAGHIQLKMHNRQEAAASFEEATLSAPRFFCALYAAGELQATLGRFDQALSFYQRAYDVKADTGLAIKLGVIYEMKSDFANAGSMYEKAIEMAPNNFIGYNQLAWLYAEQGKNLDKALQLAKTANKLMPGNASIQDTIGWIFYQQKKYEEAVRHLEAAKKTNPDNPTTLYHLGAAYNALGKREQAKENITQALKKSTTFKYAGQAQKLLSEIE